MHTQIVSILSAAFLFGVTGCGADAASPTTGTPVPGEKPNPVPGEKPNPEVTSVAVSGFVHGEAGAALPGADICFDSEPYETTHVGTCTTSDARGAWAVSAMPGNTKIRITFAKAGYASALRVVETNTVNVAIPTSENELVAAGDARTFMGVPVDGSKGRIEFFAKGPPGQTAETTVVLVAIAGDTVASAIYLGADGEPASGVSGGARGGFVNLRPGYYELTFSSPSAVCAATPGLYGYPVTLYEDPASKKATLIVPVLDGYVTTPVVVTCLSAN